MNTLNLKGYLVVEGDDAESFKQRLKFLGSIAHECDVKLNPNSKSYLSNPGPVPPHTDHPYIKWIAWVCLAQDDFDGANLLFDSRHFIASLSPDQIELLSKTKLPMPLKMDSLVPDGFFNMYSKDSMQFYYAPWLIKEATQFEELDRVNQLLHELISRHTISIQLTLGQALIIDNHRLLHFRHSIAAHSQRKLHRYWIA